MNTDKPESNRRKPPSFSDFPPPFLCVLCVKSFDFLRVFAFRLSATHQAQNAKSPTKPKPPSPSAKPTPPAKPPGNQPHAQPRAPRPSTHPQAQSKSQHAAP